MKNYMSDQEFIPSLSTKRPVIVTTQYERPDTSTPFVSKNVLSKLSAKGMVKVTKVQGPYRYEVLALAKGA